MTHPAFELVRRQPIPALRLTLEDYRHRATGARHLHLAAPDDSQNVFLVAFLTVPQDSTGVAHILEHTALCGSRRYPVRDPFFMMARRSLNTFMNAFTGADWTAYPFASQNKKDFNNLLDVYLDAVFFPLLDPLDFAQEGHRLEFEKPADPASPLVYKGVVYNEMKGVLSAPVSRLGQALDAYLYPTTTYHHNSGGDPEHIPDLSYEQFKAFHARHYHPSNAVFMTYGDILAGEHQARFEEQALHSFQTAPCDFQIADERRYRAPIAVTSRYPLDGAEAARDKTHIVIGWLLGRNTDPRAVLENQLLAAALLDNSSSPLRHALETSPLGAAPSPLCGYEESNRETTFAAGLEGSNPEHAEAVEGLIFGVLRQVAEHGIAYDALASMLHQLELSQREITGDGSPYGLQLLLEALTPAIHGGDPAAALDIDPILEGLRTDIRDPEFIQRLARERLLDNPHRVRLTMAPDPTLSHAEASAETNRLARLKATLSAADQTRIVGQAHALEERQRRTDDPDVLPRVTLADVAPDLKIPEGVQGALPALPATWYAQGTNGMVYEQLVLDLPALSEDDLLLLPYYCLCVSELGSGGRDYVSTQALQAAVTGGLSARVMVRGSVTDAQRAQGAVVFAGKALVRNQAALADLLHETFFTTRFDELDHIRELIAEQRAHREETVVQRGHTLAMLAANSGLSPIAALGHRWEGLAGLKALQALDDSLDDDTALAAFAARLEAMGKRLQAAPRQFLIVSEAEQHEAIRAALAARWNGAAPPSQASVFSLPPTRRQVRQGWIASTQVHFCAKAYPAVAQDHPDAPALQILGDFLRNGYLHRAVREQGGAYGVGAGYNPDSASFRFFSYRDPRLADTLADFDRAIDWLYSAGHDGRALEEATLGVVAAIDKPGSPAGEAIGAFFAALFGRTPAQRRAFRKAILEVSVADLQRVAERYLKPELASVAAVSNAQTLKPLKDWDILSVSSTPMS